MRTGAAAKVTAVGPTVIADASSPLPLWAVQLHGQETPLELQAPQGTRLPGGLWAVPLDEREALLEADVADFARRRAAGAGRPKAHLAGLGRSRGGTLALEHSKREKQIQQVSPHLPQSHDSLLFLFGRNP